MPPRKPKRPGRPPKGPQPAIPAGEESSALVRAEPLHHYLATVRRFPLLSAEEERDLAVRYRHTGDRDALYRLATGNLRLVIRIAADFHRAFTHLLDLIQEGNLGLLQAIRRYDPFQGTRLSTYATWWIRAYIIKYLLDNRSLVKVGTTNLRRKLLFNLSREKARLERMGFEAGPKLLAESFGATEQDVIDVGQAIEARDVSIDAPVPGRERGTFHDLLPATAASPEEEIAREELREAVRGKLLELERALGKRERLVLRERLLAEEPATLQALADRLGITREGVRQIEVRLRKKVETALKSDPRLAREIEKL